MRKALGGGGGLERVAERGADAQPGRTRKWWSEQGWGKGVEGKGSESGQHGQKGGRGKGRRAKGWRVQGVKGLTGSQGVGWKGLGDKAVQGAEQGGLKRTQTLGRICGQSIRGQQPTRQGDGLGPAFLLHKGC